MTIALADRALGDLARSIPGATAVFHRHQLDFCCAGRQSLREAAAPLGLDVDAVARELESMAAPGPGSERDWREATANELIDHVLRRYHEQHRLQVPELVRLARRVETVHGARPDCPHGLADHLESMLQELVSHMQKEEQVLFPMIRAGVLPPPPIHVMRLEHEQHGVALARMVELAGGLTPPRDACNTWRALVAGVKVLREDLMQHIHLENNILFEGLNRPESAGCGGSGGGCGCGRAA